jgi:hypothetical protein
MNATMENLEYQTEMNKITGHNTSNNNQSGLVPNTDGENGVPKTEQNGLYTWTQTEEEIEIILPLIDPTANTTSRLSSKDVKEGGLVINFFSKRLSVIFRKKEILSLNVYASIDTDGCTWTLDMDGDKGTCVVITCEKSDVISWPRITE